MSRILGALSRPRRGQNMVELALVLPVCMWVVLGIIDFGRVYALYISATSASREGARYYASNPTATLDTVRTKAQAEAPSGTFTNCTFTPSALAGDQYQVVAVCTFTPITPFVQGAWGGGSMSITTQATMPKLAVT